MAFSHPGCREWNKRQPEEIQQVQPHQPPVHRTDHVQQMMMIVPVDARFPRSFNSFRFESDAPDAARALMAASGLPAAARLAVRNAYASPWNILPKASSMMVVPCSRISGVSCPSRNAPCSVKISLVPSSTSISSTVVIETEIRISFESMV